MRERYGMHTFGQSLLMARRLIEAGTQFVQVNWPSVANGNPETDSWDTHAANFGPLKNLHCPKLDRGLSALLEDMDQRGLLKETLVVAIGEFGRSPRIGVSTSGNSNAPDGRDHWPYCYSAVVAGCGIARAACSTASRTRRPLRRRRSRCIRTICWRPSTTRSASTRTWRSAITSISRASW